MARAEVRGTLSQPGPRRPASAGRLARTLGLRIATFQNPSLQDEPIPSQDSSSRNHKRRVRETRQGCIASRLPSQTEAGDSSGPRDSASNRATDHQSVVHGKGREDKIQPHQVAEVDAKVTQSNRALVTYRCQKKGEVSRDAPNGGWSGAMNPCRHNHLSRRRASAARISPCRARSIAVLRFPPIELFCSLQFQCVHCHN